MKYKNVSPFSKNFLWGSASSAFQIEGAWNEDGKGVSCADVNAFKKSNEQADTKVASDHYHKWEQDIEIMKELGLKSYRFSIAWTRILPSGNGEINEKGLEFYNKLINKLIEYNIEPIVTLYHFDFPQALVDQYDGWKSRKAIDDFDNYSRILFKNFGDRVKLWIIINEQNLMLDVDTHLGFEESDPCKADKIRHQINHHMFLAHAKIVKSCHELVEGGKIGPSVAAQTTYPASKRPEDVLAAKDHENIRANYMLDVHYYGEYPRYYWNYLVDRDMEPIIEDGDIELLKSSRMDFIALNYYGSGCVEYQPDTEEHPLGTKTGLFFKPTIYGAYNPVDNEYLPRTKWGWVIDPIGLRICLNNYHSRYHLPLLITENGMSAEDVLEADGKIHDEYRIEYIREHIKQIKLAIEDGVEMIGYCVWTIMDVLSSKNGFGKRYGLIYVDRDEFDEKDLARIPKDSFYWYKKVIASKGEEL